MSSGKSIPRAPNDTEVMLEVASLSSQLAYFEDKLIDVGLLEVSHASEFLLGHRLAKAESELAELKVNHEERSLLPMDASWVLTCATLVFLMQLGFAQLELGTCRPKNVIATYMKNIIDFVLGTFCTLLGGYAIAYPQRPIIDQIEAWKFFFHLVFQATASTIVSGAMAERTDIRAYIIITATVSGLLYSISVRWTWGGGWIAQMDPPFHDFAGSGVVHCLGGAAALAGAYSVGPRLNRWTDPDEFAPHSVPQVLSGVLLLWVGWYGFNPGSTGSMSSTADALAASNAAMTTTISAAASGLVVMSYHLFSTGGRNIFVMSFANGVLSGLVAVTAGCDVYTPWAAVAVGCGAAVVYTCANWMVRELEIDDVVDASAVHGAAGCWGCIAVGLFHPELGFVTNMLEGEYVIALLVTQIKGAASLMILGAVPILILCNVLQSINSLRTCEEEEIMGLDLWVFQLRAYSVDNNLVDKALEKLRSEREVEGSQALIRTNVEIRNTQGVDTPKGPVEPKPSTMNGAPKVPPQNVPPPSPPPSPPLFTELMQETDLLPPDATPPTNAIAKFEHSKLFTKMVSAIQMFVMLTLIVLQVFFGSTYETSTGGTSTAEEAVLATQLYNYYIGVALMMFVGFGYLMTFLRWYGLGAVGLTMMITCLGVETSLISQAFVATMTGKGASFEVDLMVILQANFAVAAFLISFGGLIGKVNPPQLVIMVVCETIFYTINKFMLEEKIQINDVGGTVVIHMFGAYFGLVIAYMLGVPLINLKEKASYVSDIFSLLGTVILWVYWPSFVAGATPAGTPDAELQLVQTILALSAAAVTTFAMSSFTSEDGKIRPVDVQNATLAGGVSIGILAGTPLTAAGALLVGSAAGALSTFGFSHLHDTCGIHNLHGMPSVLGAFISVAIPYVFPDMSVFDPMVQFRGIVITLLFASMAGVITANFMARLADGTEMASDTHYWEVADDFGKVNEMDAVDLHWLHTIMSSSAQGGGKRGAVQETAAMAVTRGPEEEEGKEDKKILPPSAQLPKPLPTTSSMPAKAPLVDCDAGGATQRADGHTAGNMQLPLSCAAAAGMSDGATPRTASGRGPKGVAFLRYTAYPSGEQLTQMVFTDKRESSGFIDISLNNGPMTPRSARGGMQVVRPDQASSSVPTVPLALPVPTAPNGGGPLPPGGGGSSGMADEQRQEAVREEQQPSQQPSASPSAAQSPSRSSRVLSDSDSILLESLSL